MQDDYDDGLSGTRVIAVGCLMAVLIAGIVFITIRFIYNEGQ